MYTQTQFDQHREGDTHRLSQTICNDCAFHVQMEDAIPTVSYAIACIHPEELDVNCANVTFCNSFQPSQEIDSPCVTFGEDEAE